jgi:putative Mg2+ transporter-C (MgtC) family protein
MDIVWNELTAGIPDAAQATRIFFRVIMATLLGAIVGYERERTGKSAGLRTHMLVSLASALFVIAPLEAGMTPGDLSRIIQGVATGIGFLGAGAILKLTDEREIRGLTTAAGIWMTAAVGLATGLGRYGLAVMSIALAWVILGIVSRLEPRDSERA